LKELGEREGESTKEHKEKLHSFRREEGKKKNTNKDQHKPKEKESGLPGTAAARARCLVLRRISAVDKRSVGAVGCVRVVSRRRRHVAAAAAHAAPPAAHAAAASPAATHAAACAVPLGALLRALAAVRARVRLVAGASRAAVRAVAGAVVLSRCAAAAAACC